MIRDSIARHMAPGPPPSHGASGPARTSHSAFIRLALSRGDDGDGACLIEPAVRCSHCGYCQSYGH